MKHRIKVSLARGETFAPIRLRVTYNNNRLDLRLGMSYDVDKFDNINGWCRKNTRNKDGQSASEVNRAITEAIDIVDGLFVDYERESIVPSADELKSSFYKAIGKGRLTSGNDDFTAVYDKFVAEKSVQNNWTSATLEKFRNLKRLLLDYDGNFSLDKLSEEYLTGFVTFLLNQGKRNTTIDKQLGFLRWFLRWCYQHEYTSTTLHDTFHPRLKGVNGDAKEVIYLEWEELMQMYECRLPDTRLALERVRDVFCFCCFTGLRYSDVKALKRSDVKTDHIEVVTKKTADGLRIELNDYARAILDKYRHICLPNGVALPVISNDKYNEHIKVLGEYVGINQPQRIVYYIGNERHEQVFPKWQLLTTHCARRTFVVNALRLGIPAEVIMSWTGHSNYEAMKPYVKIVDALKASEMKKFNAGIKASTQNSTHL